MNKSKAMVLAAGLGTRLRPLTDLISKPMAPIVNRPVMEHIIRLLVKHNFTDVVCNLHWYPDEIRNYFGILFNSGSEEERCKLIFLTPAPRSYLRLTSLKVIMSSER